MTAAGALEGIRFRDAGLWVESHRIGIDHLQGPAETGLKRGRWPVPVMPIRRTLPEVHSYRVWQLADKSMVEKATRPLFQFDPGWLFIAAGLAVCASGVLVPAQADLDALRNQLDQLKDEETRAYARLKAHSDFMDQVDRADPALVRRLAAAQLNMVPQGDTPVLLVAAANSPVTDWIDATVKTDIRPQRLQSASMLSRIANGSHRLWLFGGGIMSVFIGLLLSPVRLWSRPRNASALTLQDEVADREFEHSDELPSASENLSAIAIDYTHAEPAESGSMLSWHDQEAPAELTALTDLADADQTDSATEETNRTSGDDNPVKASVLMEPRLESLVDLSALDLLDEHLQDELDEIEQDDDRQPHCEPALEEAPECQADRQNAFLAKQASPSAQDQAPEDQRKVVD